MLAIMEAIVVIGALAPVTGRILLHAAVTS